MVEIGKNRKTLWQAGAPGQALLEYALILILVAVALAAALIATGPALGNVFSNTVYNLIGQNGTPQQDLYNRGGPTEFWKTITAVAANPPQDRAVPTNPRPPEEPPPTAGPSPTATPVTPTRTPTFTPTVTMSATPKDFEFTAPFIDPIDRPDWWRVDSSVWLGGDDWRGEYHTNRDLNDPSPIIKYNGQLNAAARFNMNFEWGAGSPLQFFQADNFSVRWTRKVYVFGQNPVTVNFSIRSDEGVRLCVDKDGPNFKCSDPGGTVLINRSNRTMDDEPDTASYQFSGGPNPDSLTQHVITLEYYEASGNAGIIMNMSNFKGNVLADQALPSGPANCQWARATGSQPNTISWAWEESPLSGDGFPANMRCNLELRGYVDIAPLTNPQLTFYEVWDFSGSANAKLQIAEYQAYNPDGTGGPNWAGGVTIPLRSGSKNYAWTQNTIPIPAALHDKQITYRFVLESAGGSGARRYYIDDIEIRDANTRTFSVWCGNPAQCQDGAHFNLDNTGEKVNFITTGRWDLTSTNTADNSPLSWDVSKSSGGRYVRFGPEQGPGDFRIHAIEFNGEISLPFNLDGTGGLPDFEGDEGFPLLSFYHAYDIDTGESIAVEWTRDARDATPDNWQTLQNIATGPTGSPMDKLEIPLNTIPNWNTPFRLRFAFKVDKDNSNRGGWWIDNINIERKGRPRFGNYPFCEDAESGAAQWLFSGQWGTSNIGAFGSSRSYTDSPLGNYIRGQETAMEQKYVIDYNNDSPENYVAPNTGNRDCSGNPSGAAVRPILTFWHFRSLGSNHSISVDLYRPGHAPSSTTQINWTPIWTYNYVARTRAQLAWERVEIDLQSSIETLTGQNWAALKANANLYDDDFMFRIRLDTRSGAGAGDGVYIDNVNVGDYAETSHKLWDLGKTVTFPATEPPGGGGNGGRYADVVDTPAEWWLRWNTGGEWTAIDWDARSGTRSFHDHADQGTTYRDKQYTVLEMTRIIDLRGTLQSDQPTLYFWNHYDTGDDDKLLVQVAIEDRTRNTQNYDYIRGWGSATSYGSPNFSSWQTIWSIGEFKRVDTWIREQIDLRPFADNDTTGGANEGRRIRIRFVLDTYDQPAGLRQGWWIDDVVVEHREPRVIGLPFFDAAQNTSNWITEGTWGLAPDLWRGAGGGPAALGNDPYDAFYFDCIRWSTNYNPVPVTPPNGSSDLTQSTCTANNTNNMLNSIPRTNVAATNAWLAARLSFPRLTGQTSTINYDFGTTGRPPGAPTGTAGSTWENDFVGRWFRDITVLAGDYTFITTSNEGVRLRYETIPAGGAPPNWNIINNWSIHGRTVDLGTVNLAAGTYMLVLEWFENTGSATIILQVGNNNFSFSDSPKASASPSDPMVPSVAYGNSSLILNGLLNLNNPGIAAASWIPRLQYYTYYDLGASATAQTEVTIDGGFSWTTANLRNNCPGGVAKCEPVIPGTGPTRWLQANGDWELRSHDLRSYANRNIGLRFRLNTISSVRDGWWITEIQVNN